jgi:hypothetical protein
MFAYSNLAVVHGDDDVFLCKIENRTHCFHCIGNGIRGNRLRQDSGPDELRACPHDAIFRLEKGFFELGYHPKSSFRGEITYVSAEDLQQCTRTQV